MEVKRELSVVIGENGEIRYITVRVKTADEVTIRGNSIKLQEELAETVWGPESKENLIKEIEEIFSDLEKRTAELLNKRKKIYSEISEVDAEVNLRYESEYDC